MICRSAITGQLVKPSYAKRYPHLTVCEAMKKVRKAAPTARGSGARKLGKWTPRKIEFRPARATKKRKK